MYCPNCGTQNPAQASTCGGCGVMLEAHCPHCAASLPAGARFCPACGQPSDPAQGRAGEELEGSLPSGGGRKLVTVLFADFAGYTAFVEKRDPEDVQEYLTSIWARLDGIIASHGGTTEKHIGDALMAIFGSQRAHEDDPVQATRAALAIQDCVRRAQPGQLTSPLQMRVGIHTGWVVLSPANQTGERLATGDTVNLASRLESSAPLGGVLISQDTYRQAYGYFDVQGLPPLTVRGKSEPVQTYLVLRARPRSLAHTLRGIEGVETELVGREQELERLCSIFRDVMEQRQLAIVTVLGEAGIGKSRLLHEFRKWLEVLPQRVRFFYGRAAAEWAGLPFALIRDVFAARFEIQESDTAGVARQKFARGFEDLLTEAGAHSMAGELAIPSPVHISQILGFDAASRARRHEQLGGADQLRYRAFHDLARFFQLISLDSPSPPGSAGNAVLLALEDIHWADDSSLDLVEYIARHARKVPLMVLTLARPQLRERRRSWAQDLPYHTQLTLGPLSSDDSGLLIQSLLRKLTQIPAELRELVLSGAEGNPFYIEEMIKMLIDQKVIIPDQDQWAVEPQRLVAAAIPPTLTGVLQARLDRLEPYERAVLQRASVIGQVFWDRAVARLSGTARPPPPPGRSGDTTIRTRIEDALEALRSKELIVRRESAAFAGMVEYAFKHELLRNVAYAGLLKKTRRGYHAEAAAWLIEQSSGRVTEYTAPVAAHFEQAGRLAEAADWYGRAGQQARAGYAPATASAHFQKALELLPASADPDGTRRQKLEWHEGLSETLAAQARFVEAIEKYQVMRELAEVAGDLSAQARARNGLAFLHERRGQNRASLEAAREAEALARRAGAGSRAEVIHALHLQGWALYRMGDAPAVLALGEQTLKLCYEFGETRGVATSLKLHGVAHLQLGHFDEAEKYFRQGLTVSEQSGDRRNAGAMWNNLGETARLRGDFRAAVEFYEKALSVAREIGHRESEVIYLSNLSGARLGLGQFEEAESELRQAIALISEAQSCTLAETYNFLSTACLGQGKIPDALDSAERALALARESENNLDLGGAWLALGRALAAARGPLPEGKSPATCFAESLRVFESIHAQSEQARVLQAWAEFEAQQGHAEESRKRLEAAERVQLRLNTVPSSVMPRPAVSRDDQEQNQRQEQGSGAK